MILPEVVRREYENLYSSLSVRPERQAEVDAVVNRILKNRVEYETVSSRTGVPWPVVAVVHSMESGLNFTRHLHNGDPLTARTVQEPAGRPEAGNPPFTWEQSAVDALEFDGAAEVQAWSLSDTLWFLERFNGLGYRQGSGQGTTPPHRSPYLWSYSNHYERGKYVADGRFSADAVSEQCGAAVLLHELGNRGVTEFRKLAASPLVCTDFRLDNFDGNVLQLGSRGASVLALQKALNRVGCGPLAEDGAFECMTEGGVLAFQRRRQIEPTAKVGATTWAALQSALMPPDAISVPPPPSLSHAPTTVLEVQLATGEVLALGTSGPKVYAVENALNTLGYAIKVDGTYDSETEGAVKLFQRDHQVGLTGQVGQQTLCALKAALSVGRGHQSVTNSRLLEFYSTERGYKQVEADVLTFYPPLRPNGCVAFMSTALRCVGVDVPFYCDASGESISLVTRPFADWLANQGWIRIDQPRNLLPGDVCFSIEDPNWPSYPAHTYMLQSWIGTDFRNAQVVDNQAFTHPRNIFAHGSFKFSPFAFALRASD